jgi:hypothetical protein
VLCREGARPSIVPHYNCNGSGTLGGCYAHSTIVVNCEQFPINAQPPCSHSSVVVSVVVYVCGLLV